MGAKRPDLFGAFGCSACHSVVDGADAVWEGGKIHRIDIRLWFYEGVYRTQQIWLDEGLIKI